MMQKTFQIKSVNRARIYPLGVSFEEDGLRVSAVCEGIEETGLLLYDRRHRDGVRIPFPENCRVGAVYTMLLSGYHDKTCSYLFYSGRRSIKTLAASGSAIHTGTVCPNPICPDASPLRKHTNGVTTKMCISLMRRCLSTHCM